MTGIDFTKFIPELIFVAIIVVLQFRFFFANSWKRNILKGIFPQKLEDNLAVDKDEEGVAKIVTSDKVSDTLRDDIIAPINSYLENNKGATDYHIIKDLSDRTCDKIQDEVDSYNPIPLYLGLCGTMLGIIFGIFFLFRAGGLESLLASASSAGTVSGEAASEGIQHLLGGVAVAMIASLVGVILTIIGTRHTKEAVSANEEGRNKFLSWIQSNLLPKMSSDVVSTLGNFYTNLNEFNSTFSQNSRELQKAFEAIKSAYAGQTEYTRELNKLDIAKAQMAFAALGSATDKINDLNEFLKGSSQYLANVVALANKLDTADERTKAIERMGQFFQSEIEQISARKALLSETVGKIDLNLKNSLDGLQTSSIEHVGKLQTHLNKVYLDFQDAVGEQQKILEQKLSESSLYLEQFKRLETIQGQLDKLLKSEEFIGKADAEIAKLDAQIGRLDRIEAAVNRMIEIVSKRPAAAAAGVKEATLFDNPQLPQDLKDKVNPLIPRWLAFTTCGVLIAAGIFSIVYPLLIKFLV